MITSTCQFVPAPLAYSNEYDVRSRTVTKHLGVETSITHNQLTRWRNGYITLISFNVGEGVPLNNAGQMLTPPTTIRI